MAVWTQPRWFCRAKRALVSASAVGALLMHLGCGHQGYQHQTIDPPGPTSRATKKRPGIAELREDLLYSSPGKHLMYWTRESFPVEVVIHNSMSRAATRAMEQSLEHWNVVVGARVFVVRRHSQLSSALLPLAGRILPFRTVSVVSRDLGHDRGFYTHGTTSMRIVVPRSGQMFSGVIEVDRDLWRPDQLRLVSVHELGHALGLGHDSSIRSVMFTNAIESWGLIESRDVEHVQTQVGLRTHAGVVPWNNVMRCHSVRPLPPRRR